MASIPAHPAHARGVRAPFPQEDRASRRRFAGEIGALDVGCGTGRFADVATRCGAKVVGIDLSQACEVAARNLAGRDFVAMQADVFSLPFSLETFDCIYGIGVPHHTPDCEAAFKRLPQYLKPGGTIGVWLYSAYNGWYRFSNTVKSPTASPFDTCTLFCVSPCPHRTGRNVGCGVFRLWAGDGREPSVTDQSVGESAYPRPRYPRLVLSKVSIQTHL